MPIYEYRCTACSHELDALQKLNEAPLKDCPECGKAKLRRLVSAPSFRLKGAGWYETDFKSDKERKRNVADGGDKSSGGEAKPAAGDSKSADAAAKSAGSEKPSGEKSSGEKSAKEKPASKKGSSSAVA
jgi:putative FmdB family regulatory protein